MQIHHNGGYACYMIALGLMLFEGSSLSHDHIEWQRMLKDFKDTQDVAYQGMPNECDPMWCIKGLIATRSNFVVTWNITINCP